MKKLLFPLSFLAIIALSACNNSGDKKDSIKDSTSMTNETTSGAATDNFRSAMRKLWEDHVTWTRNVIFCLVDDLPGADQAVKRLLQNQDDSGIL